MYKPPEDPLEAVGEAIGTVATLALMSPVVAIAAGTTFAVYNLMNS